MACNWHVITCHYMHYMSLHAIEDANARRDRTMTQTANKNKILFCISASISRGCAKLELAKHLCLANRYILRAVEMVDSRYLPTLV